MENFVIQGEGCDLTFRGERMFEVRVCHGKASAGVTFLRGYRCLWPVVTNVLHYRDTARAEAVDEVHMQESPEDYAAALAWALGQVLTRHSGAPMVGEMFSPGAAAGVEAALAGIDGGRVKYRPGKCASC